MSCIEKSIAIYHQAGATVAGTLVTVPNAVDDGNIWKTITVVNDTDQDIKVEYKSTTGYNGAFIVPKSIKGFTKALKGGVAIDSLTLVVKSLHASSTAVGNISINLGV